MAFPPGFKPYSDTPEGFKSYGDTPDGFKPYEEPDKPKTEGFLSGVKNLYSKAVDKTAEFFSEHPDLTKGIFRAFGDSEDDDEILRKSLFSDMKPSERDEWLQRERAAGHKLVGQTLGPGFMSIPGADKITNAIAEKITGSEGNFRLAAGAVTKAIGDIVSSGLDPRAVSVGHTIKSLDPNVVDVHDFRSEPISEPPVKQPITSPDRLLPITRAGEEIPYRMEETEAPSREITPEALQRGREQTLPYQRAREIPPDMLSPEELDIYNRNLGKPDVKDMDQKIFDIAREKQGLGQDLPDEMYPPQRPEGMEKLTDSDIKAGDILPPKGRDKLAPTEELSESIEPQMARTKEGKLQLGADIESLGDILGSSLYKGDIAHIATKELMQNAIDATRHLGDRGQVDVHFAEGENAIEVADNGKGLNRKELETVFTDLGSSGKRTEAEASGGFGLAKASYLLGSRGFEVSTVSPDPKTGKKLELSFNGNRDSLLKGDIEIRQRNVPDSAQTGTKVKVLLPEGSSTWKARDFVKSAAKHSPDIPQTIRQATTYNTRPADDYKSVEMRKKYNMKDPYAPNFEPQEKGSYVHLATLDNPSARTELSVPKETPRMGRDQLRIHMLNNGMYQGSYGMWLGGEVPNIPESIAVNIKSKVPEGHSDYPFTANREEIRGTVGDAVSKYIQDNLINPSNEHRKAELTRLYNSMPFVTIGKGEFPDNFGTKIYMYDPKGQLTPMEMQQIMEAPSMQRLTKTMHDILVQAQSDFGSKSGQQRLERFGIIFHDDVHGIHIPNPATKKSAILINPFLSFAKPDGKGNYAPKPADQAGANILHTILHELVHTDDRGTGHNESFTVLLGEVYAKFGAQSSMAFQNRIIDDITSDDSGKYNLDIQEVLSKYIESRRRPATQEDLLSGTGIKRGSKTGGKDSVPEDDRSDGNRVTAAVTKLLSALEDAKSLNTEQAELLRKERARRFAQFEGVKTGGKAGAAKSLGKLRGSYQKVEGSELPLSDEEADILFNAVKRANITTGEKARAYTALFKLLEGGNVPQRNEIQILDDVFGNGFGNRIMEMQGGLGAVSIPLAKAANTMKSFMTMIHFSAPLRQALPLIHTPEWRNAFVEMFKMFADEKLYNATMQAIEQRPYYLLGRDSGLFLSKPNDMNQGEEVFLNNYVYNIPKGSKGLGVRNVYEASQRSYIGFLNKLRSDLFDSMIDDAKARGLQPFTTETVDGKTSIVPSDVARNIAKFVNLGTGRGSLGAFEKISSTLNAVLWSPRMISSRLTMLNPAYYIKLDPYTRIQALKALLALAAGSSGILMLAQAIGGKVNWTNPTSVDYHKARFGRAVLDPNGGFEQPVVAAARMIQEVNRMHSSRKPGFGEQNIKDLTENYFRNKETPMAHLIDSLITARNYTGGGSYVDRFGNKTSVGAEVKNAFTPIFIQDFVKLMNDDPTFAEAVGLSGANLFGAGLQDYSEKNSSKNRLRMNMRLSPSH